MHAYLGGDAEHRLRLREHGGLEGASYSRGGRGGSGSDRSWRLRGQDLCV